MSDEKKQIPINLDPNLYTISNVNLGFSEEEFTFTVISGNQARRFSASPKHAKRIFLLLQKFIKDYEDKFGEIETKLPEKPGTTKKETMGFK